MSTRTILFWPRTDGWLAVWWEPNRSAPYDCKWGATKAQAFAKISF